MRKTRDACLDKLRGQLVGRRVAGLVAVVRDEHALDGVRTKRRQVFVGEAFDAIARRHVRKPAHQNVSASMSDSQRIISLDSRKPVEVPHAAVRPRQIQMQRRARCAGSA